MSEAIPLNNYLLGLANEYTKQGERREGSSEERTGLSPRGEMLEKGRPRRVSRSTPLVLSRLQSLRFPLPSPSFLSCPPLPLASGCSLLTDFPFFLSPSPSRLSALLSLLSPLPSPFSPPACLFPLSLIAPVLSPRSPSPLPCPACLSLPSPLSPRMSRLTPLCLTELKEM